MRWSAVVEARGDRVVTREEIVELADAVAGLGGVASGIGTPTYAARIVVEAADRDEAGARAASSFADAAARAGLPTWAVTVVDVLGEDEDPDDPGQVP